jgi:hypothetical protein
MKPIIVALLLLASFDDRTPNEWLRLVTELQQQEQKLDKTDQAFLNQMVNWLTMDREPTLSQQKLIIDIKLKVDDG